MTLTSERRLGPGRVLRAGRLAVYREAAEYPGERHLALTPVPAGWPRRPVLLRIGHLTDLHLADVESPCRFEHFNHRYDDPRFRLLVPTQRPQEALTPHAAAGLLSAMRRLDIDLLVVSGDATDNAQHNERLVYEALVHGGAVTPRSGGAGYSGVQSVEWPDDLFWKPDGPAGEDRFQADLGYPGLPGLMNRALAPFAVDGVAVPVLEAGGNHDVLIQGVGRMTPAIAAALTGGRKPAALPPALPLDRAAQLFTSNPELFMEGATRSVPANAARRPARRTHLAPALFDTPAARLALLDTARLSGGADGFVEPQDLEWLDAVAAEAAGRLVVLVTHHPSTAIDDPGPLLDLIDRRPNIGLWLNGHTHRHRVRRLGSHEGCWEVTTAAVVDWPSQGRLVEILDFGSGDLGIALTVVDHEGGELAALHRELAANMPRLGFGSALEGARGDRNVVFALPG